MKKYLVFIVSIVLLFLIGCDGQDLKHKSASEVLEAHKLLDSFSERIQFSPENYIQVQQDTILNSGVKVNIKYYSDMDISTSILKSYKTDSLTVKHYYRCFNAEVNVTINEELIFSKTVNTAFIEQQLNTKLDDYILKNIEVLETPRDSKYRLQIYLQVCKPENKSCKAFTLLFLEDNTFTIKETDNNYVRT